MNILCQANQAKVSLLKNEGFYFKPSLLQGCREFDWALPFPLGSPFIRLYHQSWFMKRVEASEPKEISIFGNHARGNFQVIQLAEGQRYYISTRHLAGFSRNVSSIHTRIKVSLSYWLLRHHFFSIFEGPGTVLVYGPSAIEPTEQQEFQPERIVAFEVNQAFRPLAPTHRTAISQTINLLFSHEVIWQFERSSQVYAETCVEGPNANEGWFKRFLKHLLGFFRL
jgi:hypothetical protein